MISVGTYDVSGNGATRANSIEDSSMVQGSVEESKIYQSDFQNKNFEQGKVKKSRNTLRPT